MTCFRNSFKLFNVPFPDVSAQIALVSEVLKSIINDSSGDLFKEPSIKLNVVAPKLEPLETEVGITKKYKTFVAGDLPVANTG